MAAYCVQIFGDLLLEKPMEDFQVSALVLCIFSPISLDLRYSCMFFGPTELVGPINSALCVCVSYNTTTIHLASYVVIGLVIFSETNHEIFPQQSVQTANIWREIFFYILQK